MTKVSGHRGHLHRHRRPIRLLKTVRQRTPELPLTGDDSSTEQKLKLKQNELPPWLDSKQQPHG